MVSVQGDIAIRAIISNNELLSSSKKLVFHKYGNKICCFDGGQDPTMQALRESALRSVFREVGQL